MCGDSIRKVGGEGRGRMGEREEGGGTREREEERVRGEGRMIAGNIANKDCRIVDWTVTWSKIYRKCQ